MPADVDRTHAPLALLDVSLLQASDGRPGARLLATSGFQPRANLGFWPLVGQFEHHNVKKDPSCPALFGAGLFGLSLGVSWLIKTVEV